MGSPLRVLHVVVNMNRGGAETLIMNLYRNIDHSKIQFDFLTCKKGIFDQEIKKLGGRVYRVPYITEAGPFNFVKQLDNFFHSHSDYRIVHSHLDKMSGLVLRTAKKAGVPVRIAHSHNTKSEGGAAAKLYKWYAGKLIESSATHRYACSYAAAAWLFGKDAEKFHILKNGIEIEKFCFSKPVGEKVRKSLGIDQEALVLGHVGRFSAQKNHLFLLDVFAGLVNDFPDAVLLLAGDGPLKEKIKTRAKELNLKGKVKLLGVRDDIPDLLQAFDLFIFPSLHEGLPVTLIEAQGAGLPCVVADTITREVDMGGGWMHYLSLSDQTNWIKTVANLATALPDRKVYPEFLAEKGYDIKKTASMTEDSYLTLGREAT